MEEIFVTKVHINKVRHLEDLPIPLSDTERKHLILTGKNGSGKTSVLEGIVTFLSNILAESFPYPDENTFTYGYVNNALSLKRHLKSTTYSPQQWKARGMMEMKASELMKELEDKYPVQLFSKTNLYNKHGKFQTSVNRQPSGFIIKYFSAKRFFKPEKSPGAQKIELKNLHNIREDVNKDFVQHLVNLRVDLLDLKDTGNNYQAEQIEKWFQNFENTLKDIFEDESLKLVFDRPNFNYNIIIKNREPFNLNQLSDGYGAFLSIVSEIMMRIDNRFAFTSPYNLEGIVLIDEIETHLHIDLQKKILPFLTAFFPKIQFIVTTHSPFVLSSIDNAVIYDLEKQIRVEDLSDYKYHEIVDTYFETNQYSDFVEKQVNKYEALIAKTQLTEKEEEKLYELRKYFRKLPFFLSPELQLKIQSLELYPQNTPA